LNIHDINDIRQTEIRAFEPLVSKLGSFKIKIAIEKVKRYKLSGIDQILAELIKQEIIHYILRFVCFV